MKPMLQWGNCLIKLIAIMFIKNIVRAPYICTVPSSGVRAIKCYPDAKTYIINGEKFGYSKREQTMIAPLGISVDKIKKAQQCLEWI